jgi:hypothetical protein
VTFAEARSFMNWRWNDSVTGNSNFGNHWWNSNRPTQQSFVRVASTINEWGTKEVNGTLQVQTRTITQNGTIRQGTSVTAIWTANGTRPINSLRTPQNFTYVFYTAKLVNASASILDFKDQNLNTHDLYVNGSWTVYNVTSTITIISNSEGDVTSVNRNQNAVALATKAYGELSADNDWKDFTLTITGVDQVSGSVISQRITSRTFNAFKISEDDSASTVTPADVANVVKSYGSTPGWGSYNQCMDYNFNYKIDITDLATVAANINQE